jgi:hypothetical protein
MTGFALPARDPVTGDWDMGPAKGIYRICRYLSVHASLGQHAGRMAEFLRDTRHARYTESSDPDFYRLVRALINRALVRDYVGGRASMAVFSSMATMVEGQASFVSAVTAKKVRRATGLVMPDESWVTPPYWTE